MSWESIASAFIKEYESCSLLAYHGAADRPGLFSCGWGSTGPDITSKTMWTRDQADERFLQDLHKVGDGVDFVVTVELNYNEKAACVSFAYNCGLHSFESSTLLRKLNDSDVAGCAKEFLKWDMANGVHVAGLLRRRKAEMALFLKEPK